MGSPVAMAVHNLNISGKRKKEVNVGELTVQLCPTIAVGQPAPSFEVNGLDGKTIRLEDFRGKVVLLNFWTTWNQMSREQLPALKAVYDAFGNDPRFAMLGLSLDESAEPVKQFVQKHEIPWPQAHLGDWSQTTLPAQYRLGFIPSVYIVGADANLTALGPRDSKIREEVEKALTAAKGNDKPKS